MWKWIVGAALLLVVLLFVTCYRKYTELTAGGDTAAVMIGATPSKVFASLADPDSAAIWMAPGTTVTAAHHGIFVVGDTMHIDQSSPAGLRHQQYTWTVTGILPNQLMVLEMRNDSSGMVMAMRRDSLVPVGDSTQVISTISAPMMDSLRARNGDTNRRVRGALLSISSKVLVSAFRVLSDQELRRLKAHLEGTPAPAK